MEQNSVHRCVDLIKRHLRGIAAVKKECLMSAGHARRNKRSAKNISIVLGVLVTIVGVVLARGTNSTVNLPYTNIPFRELLSYASAFLGAAIALINQRFDPARFREREVALGDLISSLREIEEQAELKLPGITAGETSDAENFFRELQGKERSLLEDAEKLKAGVRVIFESGVAG